MVGLIPIRTNFSEFFKKARANPDKIDETVGPDGLAGQISQHMVRSPSGRKTAKCIGLARFGESDL
jgi:hypothetical protein